MVSDEALDVKAAVRRPVGGLIRNGGVSALLAINLLTGFASAFLITSLSLFLADRVRASPLMIGLFFAGRALTGVVGDVGVGFISDRRVDRRLVIGVCAALSGLGAIGYAYLRGYYALFGIGSLLLGLGGASFPQLFAYNREFAQTRDVDATFFNSLMRSVGSAVWIVAPPVGFAIISAWSFTALYTLAGALYFVAAVWTVRLPASAGRAPGRRPKVRLTADVRRRVALLTAVVVLLLTANGMYTVGVALFVTQSLHFPTVYVGLLLSVAAAIEVPMMLYFGAKADVLGPYRLIALAAVCAALFFVLLPFAHSLPALLVLQIPNAFWTSIALSIPVSALQDMLPHRTGTASSIYSASLRVGLLLAGLVAGFVGQEVGYARFFWAPAALAAFSAVAAGFLRDGRGRVG